MTDNIIKYNKITKILCLISIYNFVSQLQIIAYYHIIVTLFERESTESGINKNPC